MSRPDPIQYAERLYEAIRAANFSPMSFLAFGNAVKEGVAMRNMPRIAAEPFMRIVGEMLDLEQALAEDAEIIDADVTREARPDQPTVSGPVSIPEVNTASEGPPQSGTAEIPTLPEKRRNASRR